MYLDQVVLRNVRTFKEAKLDFVHPDRVFRVNDGSDANREKVLPKPRLPNVNLLLGDNGSGKSTALSAIALSTFGPAVKESLLRATGIVRRGEDRAVIDSRFRLHEQDLPEARGRFVSEIWSKVFITHRRDLEIYGFEGQPMGTSMWDPVYETKNAAFFVAGYGPTRRVERPENFDMGARTKARFGRAQRVQSLFEDSFSLIPLSYWLPRLRQSNHPHYTQVTQLLDAVLNPTHYTFHGELEKGDYLFERAGNRVPFLSMSDGYRAFIGWIGDLLYHICYGCPPGKKLVESRGIVMVDEIDLHLHPRWQMAVIKTVAKALPRMQFIFTSHSPLVAGSLEWMNIIKLTVRTKTNRTIAKRLHGGIHGLDADQILLTEYFGLKSTRATTKMHQLTRLRHTATLGDDDAKRAYVQALGSGMESIENGQHDSSRGGCRLIRHQITPAELRKRIKRADPSWYERAAHVLQSLPKKPKAKDFQSLWRDIVQVYRTLQGSKCIYCETMIEGDIANDIEHFRPKAKVAVWKPPQIFVAAGVTPTPPAGPKGDPGYRDLAYHPWNYAASCKVCNIVLKKNYFPILGSRRSTATDPREMQDEQAFFIYPIGSLDDDPEKLIRFDGMHPEPRRPREPAGIFGRLPRSRSFS